MLDLRYFLKMASAPEHVCGMCVAPSEGRVDPSEWSYYSLLICAVAAAWKLENPPRSMNPMQRLTALAARVVSEKCKFVEFVVNFPNSFFL